MNGRGEEEGLFHPWFHASISLSAALIWWDFSVLKMLTPSLSLLFVNIILGRSISKIFLSVSTGGLCFGLFACF